MPQHSAIWSDILSNSNWKDIAELIGIAAIVASLLFVGLQMKQSQEIALSAAYQARTEVLVEFLTSAATDEVARAAMAKNFSGAGGFTPDERTAATFMTRAGVALMQNSHYQYSEGFLDEEHWQSVRTLIKQQLQTPIGREVLSDGQQIRPSFKRVVDEISQEISAEAN